MNMNEILACLFFIFTGCITTVVGAAVGWWARGQTDIVEPEEETDGEHK